MRRSFKLLFLSVFLTLGIALSVASAWGIYRAYRANSWPSVPGQVLEDECRRCSDGACSHEIRYQYSVAGTTYINDREYFGFPVGVGACLAAYRRGDGIRVFFDSANPANSALKPGAYRPAVFGFVGGLLFTAFAVFGFCFFSASLKPDPALKRDAPPR